MGPSSPSPSLWPSARPSPPSAVPLLLDLLALNTSSSTTLSLALPRLPLPSPVPPSSAHSSVLHMRLALTVTHLLLVSLGSVNLLVIFVILIRPYMRSITNVYMISLCLADFIYLTNLTLVAVTQLNDKSWPFSSFLCTLYHGTETTGKYASVMFVVLLAVDRYCAMCKSNWCARYRTYRGAVLVSLAAWLFAALAASPLYFFAEVALLTLRSPVSPANRRELHKLCIAKWPNSDVARWYITISSVLIFALPLAVIFFCYYHILSKLREALKSCKRMKRGASSRAPYHRVTRLVLWVVVFHVLSWSPFWLFNLFSSIFRLRISTQFDRVVVNIIHLFPYVNCALNPILYVAHAENFRVAFRSLFCAKFGRHHDELLDATRTVVPGTNGFSIATAGGSSVLMGGSAFGRQSVAGENLQIKQRTTFARCSSSSEGVLLTSPPTAKKDVPQRPSSVAGKPCPCAAGGSAASLLLDCPKLPLRANSAKHSVITLECSGAEQTGGGVRRRGNGTEVGTGYACERNGHKRLKEMPQMPSNLAQKRSLLSAKSPLLLDDGQNIGEKEKKERRETETDEIGEAMGEEGDEFV
ncbi:hypothetical protein niasHS_002446 [Heterodera schachtii]|uniref:G-protein coupled receptors family 1 profile domain-containing protein n=1 Tax=Heterodera schachtii TaxID=97005 RepID=A0ABD2KJZ3_HETSC